MSFTRRTRGPGKHGYLRGGQRPREYSIWVAMVQRCYNPRAQVYHYYGGRGIRVCDRWLEANGFANFLRDLGRQPHRRASLHRVNNDGDYIPGNVVWAAPRTQSRHRRSNHVLSFRGKSQILADWAAEMGMKKVTLLARLRKGWPPEKALTQPVEPRRPYSQWKRRNPNPRKPGPKPRYPVSAARQSATPPGLALSVQRSTGNAAGVGAPGVVSDTLSGVARDRPQ